jgi:hypothetical protein
MLTLLDHNYQLRNDGEDLNLKPIELIEAHPCCICSQALKEFGHRLIIDATLTIEDIAMPCKLFSQLLDCLCFACASRSYGSTSILEMLR